MGTTIGKYIEAGLERGKIANNQIVVYYDKNGNIQFIGKAEFTPVYLDRVPLDRIENVGNEMRVYEKRGE